LIINRDPDYETAKKWKEKMIDDGIKPDIVTYNILINRAPDCGTAKKWLDAMAKDGIKPDIVTYNTLINKAPDYDTAKELKEKMIDDGIKPDIVTYNKLIHKAPDYDTAKGWLDTMVKNGIKPSINTYCNLFTKDLSHQLPDDILKWYLSQKYHYEKPIQIAITSYYKYCCIAEALRLILDYPHLEIARKIIRENSEEAILYFRTISEQNNNHPNADYALGVTFMELEDEKKAKSHLKKALKLAKPGPRKLFIKECLYQIDNKLSRNTR
jgi:tetratricopeptide (TPR) repeat protein